MTDEYTSFDNDLSVLSEKLNLLPKIDALIFDIDGVVLDVRGSFRAVISKTVQFYFSEILKWPGSALLITPEETQLFKLAGGFNNDWDLTFIVALFYLARAQQWGSRDLNMLGQEAPALADFAGRIREEGGGLVVAEELVLGSFSPEERSSILELWDRALIQRIFQEFYAGTEYCLRLYGFEPSFVKETGLIKQEKLLLDAELVRPWRPKIGVVTGRTREEAEVALEISRLKGLVPSELVIADEGELPRKPNPEVLRVLAERMESSLGIYFGDTPDDLATVENYRKLTIPSSFISCIIIHREGERELYLARRADILAKNVNDVLIFLRGLKGEE